MAGLQVLHQALATSTTVVAPERSWSLTDRVAMLVREGVDALSATPTLWRMILQLPVARDWPLRQITLGGEIADQLVLDALSRRYPSARVVHVFASTETGAAFSVADGRAGFPISYLTEPPRGIQLQIREGILHVYAPDVSDSGPDMFVSTGDLVYLVEVVDDRVVFKGRHSGVANVGGVNVWPEEVERLLRANPEIADAAVSARPNPISGSILTAQVVLTGGVPEEGAQRRIRAWMRAHAASAQVPASVVIVDRLEVSAAGKVART
jgi:acyl-CoA synthetase (AMP-forming)/AMP-acid ligase II